MSETKLVRMEVEAIEALEEYEACLRRHYQVVMGSEWRGAMSRPRLLTQAVDDAICYVRQQLTDIEADRERKAAKGGK